MSPSPVSGEPISDQAICAIVSVVVRWSPSPVSGEPISDHQLTQTCQPDAAYVTIPCQRGADLRPQEQILVELPDANSHHPLSAGSRSPTLKRATCSLPGCERSARRRALRREERAGRGSSPLVARSCVHFGPPLPDFESQRWVGDASRFVADPSHARAEKRATCQLSALTGAADRGSGRRPVDGNQPIASQAEGAALAGMQHLAQLQQRPEGGQVAGILYLPFAAAELHHLLLARGKAGAPGRLRIGRDGGHVPCELSQCRGSRSPRAGRCSRWRGRWPGAAARGRGRETPGASASGRRSAGGRG